MRKHLFGCLLPLFLAFSTSARSEERSMVISGSILAPIAGGLDIQYQYKLTDYLSITIPGYFYYNWIASAIIKNADKQHGGFNQTIAPISAGGGVGARFLLANNGLNDTFYLEPRVKLNYGQFGFDSPLGKVESQTLALTPTANLGWDWYYDSGFYVGLGLGIGFNYFLTNTTELPTKIEESAAVKAWLPHEDTKVAFAWDGEFRLGYSW